MSGSTILCHQAALYCIPRTRGKRGSFVERDERRRDGPLALPCSIVSLRLGVVFSYPTLFPSFLLVDRELRAERRLRRPLVPGQRGGRAARGIPNAAASRPPHPRAGAGGGESPGAESARHMGGVVVGADFAPTVDDPRVCAMLNKAVFEHDLFR